MGFLSGLGDVLGKVPQLAADAMTGGAYSTGVANEQNIALARENRDWSQMMSNTAYQRATTDMRAAGLNPMLAYAQGGAGTPSSTAPTVDPVKMGAGLASTAENAVNLVSQQKNVAADTEKKKADTTTSESQAVLNAAQTQKNIANAKESEMAVFESQARQQKMGAETLTERQRNVALQRQNHIQAARQNLDQKAAQLDAIAEHAANVIAPINSAVKTLKPSLNINLGGKPKYAPPLTGSKQQWRDAEE